MFRQSKQGHIPSSRRNPFEHI